MLFGNPVLHKELMLRLRLRQSKPARLGLFLAIAAIVGWGYWEIIGSLLADPGSQVGITVWQSVIALQFSLICLIAPVAAANAITQEKEQQTWEMLIFTRLTPAQIIVGKLIARLTGILFLILLGLPITLFAMLRAGGESMGSGFTISWTRYIMAYVVMAICGLFYVTFGLFLSWLMKRTLYAIMGAYTFVIGVLLIGSVLVTGALTALVGNSDFMTRSPLMWLNPAQIVSEVVSGERYTDSLYLIYGMLAYLLLTALMLWRMIAGFRRFGTDVS